jgi:proton glutamate symport protein
LTSKGRPRLALHWQILIAMALGVVAGLVFGQDTRIFGEHTFFDLFDFLGSFFLRALGMLVVPLIASSVISGIVGVGAGGGLGRLGLRTLIYYAMTSLAAILTGLFLVNLIKPGISDGQPVKDLLGLQTGLGDVSAGIASSSEQTLGDILLRLIPKNPVGAAAEGEILPLVVFSILFGIFASRLVASRRQVLADFWQGVFEVMMGITNLVMWFAPLGVLGLIARTVASAGLEGAAPLLWYAVTVAAGLAFHFTVTLPLFLRFAAGVNPLRQVRALSKALLTAFSTSSSSATLPVTMDALQTNVGVSNRVASFVLPLGATVNMDGTALYECVAALFIAQAYGVDLSPMSQFLVVITALLASIGAAGIPSAGLVMVAVILKAVGLPLEGLGLILAVDRVLDMARTATNVMSDSVCTVVVARKEGESLFGE